jgi:Helix-turn-helix domain
MTYYLTLLSLHQVHRELQDADARATTVTDVATRQGFWELGRRFSTSYRELFTELPSTTLHGMPEDCFLSSN